VFGNVYPPVSVPCPRCHEQPNAVTYLYFSTAALFCNRCEHAWQADLESHPELAELGRQSDQARKDQR